MTIGNSPSTRFSHRGDASLKATEFTTLNADAVASTPDGSPDASRIAPAQGARRNAVASVVADGDASPTFLHPLPDQKRSPHSSSHSEIGDQTGQGAGVAWIKILQGDILRKVARASTLDPRDIMNMSGVCHAWSTALRQADHAALNVRITMDLAVDLQQRALDLAERYAKATIHPRSPLAIAHFILKRTSAEKRCLDMALQRRVLGLERFSEQSAEVQPIRDRLRNFPVAKGIEGMAYAAALGLEGAAWDNEMPDGGWETLNWVAPVMASVCFGAAAIGRFQLTERTGERFFIRAMILGCGMALLKGITATHYSTLDTHNAWEPAHKFATVLMIMLSLIDGILCAGAARRLQLARREVEQQMQQKTERIARLDADIARLGQESAKLTSAYHYIEEGGLKCRLTEIERSVAHFHVTSATDEQEPAEAEALEHAGEALDIQVDDAEAQ